MALLVIHNRDCNDPSIILLNRQLNELGQQEKALEAQEASLEEAIEKASSFPEKKEIEQNRWQA